jgi:hypothetical protein
MHSDLLGCFSVADHLATRAFVADVLLYDRLVIPVPDDRERERWEELGRAPDVLSRKLHILEEPFHGRRDETLVMRLPWNDSFRRTLDMTYPAERQALTEVDRSGPAPLDRVASIQWLHRHMTDRRLVAGTIAIDLGYAEVVPAYPSFDGIERDFSPTLVDASDSIDDGGLLGVLGWEVFVPDDPAVDDDTLLAAAVSLAHDPKFRQKRAAFHEWRREAGGGAWATRNFRSELERRLDDYQSLTQKIRVRTIPRHVVAFLAIGVPLAGLLVAPAAGAIGAAVLGAARFGMDLGYSVPAVPERTVAVAMFHDARRVLGSESDQRTGSA